MIAIPVLLICPGGIQDASCCILDHVTIYGLDVFVLIVPCRLVLQGRMFFYVYFNSVCEENVENARDLFIDQSNNVARRYTRPS